MGVLDVLFPEKCLLCGRLLPGGHRGVCPGCRKLLPRVTEPCCKRCGKPLGDMRITYCADCAGRESRIRQGTAVWVYDENMKRAMADFKYNGCLADGAFYADELVRERAGWIRKRGIDCIVPVPLHRRRQWFRGFNQAAFVAECVGQCLEIPVLADALVRKRYTRPQKGLDDKQRRKNLKDAFVINEARRGELAAGKNILLVDDIYTTGSTLEGCAAAIQDSGRCDSNIFFACLCIGRDY